jgi:hypothetical protein
MGQRRDAANLQELVDQKEGPDEKVNEVPEEGWPVLLVYGVANCLENPPHRERAESDAPVSDRARREGDHDESQEHAGGEPQVERHVVEEDRAHEDLGRAERSNSELLEHRGDSEQDQRDAEDVADEISAVPVVRSVVGEQSVYVLQPILRLAHNSAG